MITLPAKLKNNQIAYLRFWSAFFLSTKFLQDVKFKNQVLSKFLNCQKWEKNSKITRFLTWFLMCSQNIKRWLRICISYLVYSQIRLNIIRDDCHFGYKQKFFKKKARTSDFGFASPNRPDSRADYTNIY